ncbi:menaquinone-dependent protoporphyrinogen IX oxidase [Methanofollis sp. W23]|uniref:flavodoxin domain-containing protein n=1 Tax=Methanofollis sp. W23 TaxID=2817849 RepID=UPI001AE2E6B6|nr:flavodoxin domain-containing protein [Methanofollis sp. W23]MBP2146517.1 menaquinone-dependent protoporphyrinogen IX oxidase [Methanofollis sp. W23]
MLRTCVVYESKYGTTAEVARAFALVLGPSRMCRPEAFSEDLKSSDLFVIGTPIYNGEVVPSVRRFVETNASWLREKSVALFCTCVKLHRGRTYLTGLRAFLGEEVPAVAFGGQLRTADLDREDRNALTFYAKRTGFILQDHDLLDMKAVAAYALSLREKLEGIDQMPEEDFKARAERFLIAHSECVLATAHGTSVRATPVNYFYADGRVYIFSEGGAKFAHLVQNPRASVAIYDPRATMEEVRGMQLTGNVEVICPGDQGHKEALDLCGISKEMLASFPADLNVITITPDETVYLDTSLQNEGYAARQVLRERTFTPSPRRQSP